MYVYDSFVLTVLRGIMMMYMFMSFVKVLCEGLILTL